MARAIRNLPMTAAVTVVGLGLALVDAAAFGPEAAPPPQQSSKKKSSKTKKPAAKPDPKSETSSEPGASGKGAPGTFAREIAPILVANCAGCHNAQHRSGLNQTTFEGLMKGGKAGAAIVPGKPEESLLISRVKGEEGAKMPPGQRDLSEAAVAKLESWIKSGARLDAGLDAGAMLSSYALSAEQRRREDLAKMPASERDAKTEEIGRARLEKVVAGAGADAEVVKGTQFLLFSKLPKDRATKLLQALDAEYSRLGPLLGARRATTAGPEKVSVYLFKDRGGYIEFVRTHENQEVDDSEVTRAKLSVESPYVIAIDPLGFAAEAPPAKKSSRSKKSSSDDAAAPARSLAAIVVEGYASGALALAGAPIWVSSGLGAYHASRIDPRGRHFLALRASAFEQCRIGWPTKANEALGSQGKRETIQAIGFALFEWIDSVAAPISTATFVQTMLEGQGKLDDAISKSFGIDRARFLQGSGEWVYARYGRGR
ncbi:MAG: c-type cytochrome domain-containing protein [Isosphaeraceae bacterium]|nr:c-type cytochrome domain-containing protein [Isosphaeraceae bacterium]